MSKINANPIEAKVANTIPIAREVLKGSRQLANELAARDSSCTTQEYLAYFLNASIVLSTLVAQFRVQGGDNV